MNPSRYHVELYTPAGLLLADLAGRAKNRRITQSRNEADEIIWQLDLNELEKYATDTNTDVSAMVATGLTEVRVRRDQKYLSGGQIVWRNAHITPISQDLEIRATGFLNMLDDRYTAELRQFIATEGTTIASTLITESQAQTNGSFGITIGSLATVGVHDKEFKAVKVKEALQRCAELFNFDFEFTHDKVFNTYTAIGSQRPDVIFEYPGNIRETTVPDDATQLANTITVSGSGSGTEGNVKVIVTDSGSQATYKLREKRVSFSEVEVTADLTSHGNVELAAWSFPFEIPQLVVDGNLPPYVSDYGIGDYVKLVFARYSLLQHLNGMYRVEKRVITIDEEDGEQVTLYVSR